MTLESAHVSRLIPTYDSTDRGPGGVPKPDSGDADPVGVKTITGAAVGTSGQVRNIGTQATPIVGVDINRRTVTIKNRGTVDVYIGFDTQVTDVTGYALAPTDPAQILELTCAVYAATPAGPVGVLHWIAETDA